jgi:hypothetical protein
MYVHILPSLPGKCNTNANMKDLTTCHLEISVKKKKPGIITKGLNSSTLSGKQNIV